MKEDKRKCVKCGASPADDSETKLFRFPRPGVRNRDSCQLWAKYCCPDKPWYIKEFQLELHKEHRMLCHRHFRKTKFVDFDTKKLKRYAAPGDEVKAPSNSCVYIHKCDIPGNNPNNLGEILYKV